MKYTTAVLLISACTTSRPSVLSLSAPPCATAEEYGAIAGDGLDDRAQLQAAIDAAIAGPGCLDLGPGTYHATRRPLVGVQNIPSLKITGKLHLRGAGRDLTTLAMLGSGIVPGRPAPGDWTLVWITGGAAGVTISDITLDGSERIQTEEQTHLVEVRGPASDTALERLRVVLPVHGPSSGGDCFRLVGMPAGLVTRTTIRDVHAPVCDRSLLGIQRGVFGAEIYRVQTEQVGDQAIDFEPSGSVVFECAPIVRDIWMHDLVLARGSIAQGPDTVAIMGDGCSHADSVRIENSIILDGSVSVMDASNVTLYGLVLQNRAGQGAPVLLARKRVVGLRVLSTSIERVAGSVPGHSVSIYGQGGGFPTDALLVGVSITHRGDGIPIRLEDMPRFTMVGSSVEYQGAAPNPAIVSRPREHTAGSPVLVDVRVRGVTDAVKMVAPTDGETPTMVRVTSE